MIISSILKSYLILTFVNYSLANTQNIIPKVNIRSVTYIGSVIESSSPNSSIISFRGIRYAKPPIGELRFKDPQPLVYDDSIPMDYDATNDRNDCPSIYAENPSEDCLFLNIYMRSFLQTDNSSLSLKAVLVFIHPGGFYVGSALSSSFGPDYLLANNDFIVITFNYRLGTLGFLNLGTKDYPGNAALKDQVFALRWIQKNIHAFGGSNNKITLMGYSAGGFSINLHLASAMSKGLFQKAIIMSGTIPPQMKFQNEQIHLAAKQAKIMGCNYTVENIEEIIECLNTFNGTIIASKLRLMFEFGKDNPIYLWLPVLENNFGQERFLITNPYESFKNGNFNEVPILIGFTNNEFCTSAAEILENKDLLIDFNQKFSKLAPICFMYNDYDEQNTNIITNKLKQKYFSDINSNITKENLMDLCNLFSDSIIRFGAHRLSSIISSKVPVYPYLFSYCPERHTNFNFQFPNHIKGAEHMDDLMYIFSSKKIQFHSNDPEYEIVKIMVNMISSFVQSGNPSNTVNANWNYNLNNFAEITTNFNIKNGRNFQRHQIWDEIFPV